MTTKTIWKFPKNIIFTLKNDFFLKFLLIVGTKKGGLGTNLSTKKVHSEQTWPPKSASTKIILSTKSLVVVEWR